MIYGSFKFGDIQGKFTPRIHTCFNMGSHLKSDTCKLTRPNKLRSYETRTILSKKKPLIARQNLLDNDKRDRVLAIDKAKISSGCQLCCASTFTTEVRVIIFFDHFHPSKQSRLSYKTLANSRLLSSALLKWLHISLSNYRK